MMGERRDDGRRRRNWRNVAVAYVGLALVWALLRLGFGALSGSLLGLAAALSTASLFLVGLIGTALAAVSELGRGARAWTAVVVATWVVSFASLHWIDALGDVLFEDRQRSLLEYYERLVMENRPANGEEMVLVQEPTVRVILYDAAHGHVVVGLFGDVRRRSLVRFDQPAQPRSPNFDHQHLRYLDGTWYLAEPFK